MYYGQLENSQFTGIFYLHLHPYSSLAKTCFLYQTGFLRGLKFSTSHFICVLSDLLSIHCERKNLDSSAVLEIEANAVIYMTGLGYKKNSDQGVF